MCRLNSDPKQVSHSFERHHFADTIETKIDCAIQEMYLLKNYNDIPQNAVLDTGPAIRHNCQG